MNDILTGIFDWIRQDFKSHPFRFCVELVAWALSILTFAPDFDIQCEAKGKNLASEQVYNRWLETNS